MYLGIEIGGTKLQLGVSDGQQAELRQLRARTSNRNKVPPVSCSRCGNWAVRWCSRAV